ncbi:ComEC/Rec2 family competence protein (plasmid) [Microbacterium sp. NIBRBAC000506063]|nr:ComEC/Rec2 family competence protein [Microbacterium sp. NIBRBAC000506063]QTV80773.1 ComEC/Rec2 family competence protein [Microbacterium sp. NIBRBAC000506063]
MSGANCAIVVGAVYGTVALLRGGRGLRILLAAVALAAFVILVTPEPSVIRAATMAGLGMLTLLLGRPGAGVGVLSLAIGIILIVDPWLAATPGFALSAAATAALIVLSRPVSRGLARWMPEPIAIGVAVPWRPSSRADRSSPCSPSSSRSWVSPRTCSPLPRHPSRP